MNARLDLNLSEARTAPAPPQLTSVMRIALAALLLAAATASAEVVVQPDFARDTDHHTGAISLPVGETLRIEMPGPPRPGHAWQPRWPDPAPDPAIVEPVEGICPEAAGFSRSCFALTARAPGEAVVTIIYRRHWETLPDGLLRYDLTVTVPDAH